MLNANLLCHCRKAALVHVLLPEQNCSEAPLWNKVGVHGPDLDRHSQDKISVTLLLTPWLKYAEEVLLEEKRNMTSPFLGMAL